MSAGFWVLALANLFPLAGLFLLGWSGESVLLLYLFEAFVVFLVTARMLFVVGEREGEDLAMPFIASNMLGLTIVGVVWVGYFSTTIQGVLAALRDPFVLLAGAGLLVSHLFTYLKDFVGAREYERMPAKRITGRMSEFYVLLLVVPFFLPVLFGPAKLAAAALVVGKTLYALYEYGKERSAAKSGSEPD